MGDIGLYNSFLDASGFKKPTSGLNIAVNRYPPPPSLSHQKFNSHLEGFGQNTVLKLDDSNTFLLTVFFIYTLHYIHSVQKGTIKLSLEGEGKEIVVKALAWESGIRLRIGEPSGSLGRGKGGGAWKNTFDAAVPPLTRY